MKGSRLERLLGHTKASVVSAWKEKAHERPNFPPDRCWACGTAEATVDARGRPLCTPCSADCLVLLMPHLEPLLATTEAAMATTIGDTKKKEDAGERAEIRPAAVINAAQESWVCYRCKKSCATGDPACRCGNKRPRASLCPYCHQDYLAVRLCGYTQLMHDVWVCSRCGSSTMDDVAECRCCRNLRATTCSHCKRSSPTTCETCPHCQRPLGLKSTRSTVGAIAGERELERVAQIKEHRERLGQRVERMGLRLAAMGDDGNCQFRAISYQLTRSECFHAAVRFLVLRYIQSHASDYNGLVAVDVADYVTAMTRIGEWGDEVTVQAAARALDVTVVVVTSEVERWLLQYRRDSARTLHLAYVRPIHYDCIVPGPAETIEWPPLDTVFGDSEDHAAARNAKVPPLACPDPGTPVPRSNQATPVPMTYPFSPLTPGTPAPARAGATLAAALRRTLELPPMPLRQIGDMAAGVLVIVQLSNGPAFLRTRASGQITGDRHPSLYYLHGVAGDTPRCHLADAMTGAFIARDYRRQFIEGIGGARTLISPLWATAAQPSTDTLLTSTEAAGCDSGASAGRWRFSDDTTPFVVFHDDVVVAQGRAVSSERSALRFLLPHGTVPARLCVNCLEVILPGKRTPSTCSHRYKTTV